MFHRTIAFAALAVLAAGALPAYASVAISAASPSYSQNFDSLATSGTANAWVNDSTLSGWSLFNAAGAPIPTYAANTGSSNAGAFVSFGAAGNNDRALGGVGSGGAYFGAPASGAVAGYIAASFVNDTGAQLGGFDLGFDGEQWRNGGNTSAQTMVFSYGFGSSFADVTWTAPGAGFDFSSPVTGSTAAAIDGNGAGLVSGLGGNVSTQWDAGQTLWVRWTETNDQGNDHGLAIDNLSLSVAAVAPVPEPSTYALMFAGLAAVAFVARRRSR
ncbi:MAG: putative extracellular nuclease [Rhizobacter sp.]|nr:putative extracellular nuclease [Rhizobacter sp.]